VYTLESGLYSDALQIYSDLAEAAIKLGLWCGLEEQMKGAVDCQEKAFFDLVRRFSSRRRNAIHIKEVGQISSIDVG
jgi:hypothetical protein